ncbi:HEAT repeat [Trinorchestia longiramus]|nr:HEAT repeat [Trinorchestia longiramus]
MCAWVPREHESGRGGAIRVPCSAPVWWPSNAGHRALLQHQPSILYLQLPSLFYLTLISHHFAAVSPAKHPYVAALRSCDCCCAGGGKGCQCAGMESVCGLLASTLEEVRHCPQEVEGLLLLLRKLAFDLNQEVRDEAMEQVHILGRVCRRYKQQLGHVLPGHLLPLVVEHILNTAHQFTWVQYRRTGHAALLLLLRDRLLQRQQLTDVCVLVCGLTAPQLDTGQTRPEEDRSDALALLCRMVSLLKKYSVRHLLPTFLQLCSDSLSSIRRIAASNMGVFAEVAGTDITEQSLLPVFVSLCRDTVWEVRRACTDSFLQMATVCLPDTRRTCLTPVFLDLLSDQSRASDSSDEEELRGTEAEEENEQKADTHAETSSTEGCSEVQLQDSSSESCGGSDTLSMAVLKRRSCEPLGFLSDSFRPPSSPLPSVNLLDQPFLHMSTSPPKQEAEEPSFNSFNFWRIPLPDIELPDMSLALSEDSQVQNKAGDSSQVDQSSHDQSSSRGNQLERASAPTSYGDVVETQEDLDSSGDSDDTVIELSILSEGLLAIEEGNDGVGSTARSYQECVRRRMDRHLSGGSEVSNSWVLTDLASDASSSSLFDISRRVHSQDIVPHGLLENFLQMTEPRRTETDDKDICRYCAYAMPAVALTLGQDNWHILRDTYCSLSQHYQWRVRRTLAYSMHEMAAILGGDHSAADILPIYKEFTSSEPECVRMGILENLSAFVRVLPPAQRKHLLPNICTFLTINDRKLKVEFCYQLSHLLQYFSPDDVDEYLKIICLKLLSEQLNYNRHDVFELICSLVHHLGSEGDIHYAVDVCEKLVKEFGSDCVWSRRQAFVLVAGRLLANNSLPLSLYCEHILPQVLALASDRVPNVRLAVAEVFTQHIVPHEYFSNNNSEEHDVLRQVYDRLQRDVDRDVRHFAASPYSIDELNAFIERRFDAVAGRNRTYATSEGSSTNSFSEEPSTLAMNTAANNDGN